MKEVSFKKLNEIENVINELKENKILKLYFEDYCYEDYYIIKNNKVYNRYNELEYDNIKDFIENNIDLEFSYYKI